MLHPFTPNHVQLISACYPPSAALTGSVVAPNSQELSRLTYYAANKTGKLSKLGIEMEKRVKAEARRAQAGNVRYRSSLLISLQILRSLATECRRDISLLTAPILSSVVTALRALPSDLEASAKAATLFTTWTTFTDGRSVGVEKTVSSDYSAILEIFSQMSMVQDKGSDHEFRNRKRLVGLAALTATVTSEALYSSSIFRQQAPVIVFPLLFNICGTELSVLESESSKVKSEASSPYLTEFRTRPANERRAASIHIHKDGEHGPSTSDLVDTSLHALHSLFAHSAGSHITHVIHAVLESLDKRRYWDKQDVCCWLAVKTTEWSSYQHRYAVPTKLIERLVEEQDASSVTSLHNSLIAMITAIFTSSIHLVNLSTSDSISNLLTLIIRRVATSPNDPLLPSLAECIASLGTHIYYSDQIQDLSHEIISRMMTVDANGVQGKEEDKDRGSRTAAIRYLLSALVGLMFAPRRHQAVKEVDSDALNKSPRSADGLPAIETAADKTIWTAKRARVSPETWQDTLHLLCDEEFAVRSDYAYALAFFLRSEMAERKGRVDADTPRKLNSIIEEPGILSRDFVRADGDEKARMLHAMNVYIFAVATATTFRPSSSPPQASPIDYDASPIPSGAAINIVPATPVATPPAFGDHDSSPFRRPSISVSVNMRARRQSTGKKVLLHLPSRWSASQVPKASASDYRSLLDLLSALHENSPLRGLILGVPVLVALDSFIHDVGDVDELKGHVVALREVLARAWLTIGRVWECEDLIILTEKSLSSLPGSTVLPPSVHSDDAGKGAFLTTGEAMPVPDAEATWAGVDSAAALDALLSRREAFEKAGLNPDTLAERLRAPWSPQTAWTNSMEPQSGLDPLRGDSASGRIRLSSSLMLSENMSLQSLNKSSRGVGVSDLRQALEGRSSLSNPNLAPSFSTSFESDALRPSRAARPDRHKLRNDPKEVHEVLNKLKVGKSPTGSSALLKASFPALRKPVESQ